MMVKNIILLIGKTKEKWRDVLVVRRIELYLQNEDMVGWVSIAGTTINYPVMQSRNNPTFYLKHNFEKEYSKWKANRVYVNKDAQKIIILEPSKE